MTETTHPIILAVDTTAPQASFAVFAGERELARRVTTADRPHSQTFFGEIETLLQQANLTINDLTAFAAVTGPGSFTGLRVALAAVQGFAQTLQVPAWGLTTLDAVALAAGVLGRVLVVIEAGRGECYVGLRDIYADGSFTQPRADAVGPLAAVLPEFEEAREQAQEQVRYDLRFDAKAHAPTLAPVIAAYVARAMQRGVAAERHPLQACYIRPPDAKLKTDATQ